MFAAGRMRMAAQYGPPQEITFNARQNFVLATNASFLALDKTRPIIVTFTGTNTSTATNTPAVNLGDLSTWANVTVIIAAGAILRGDGGNGGVSSNGVGGAGGHALDINLANSNANLTVINNGTLQGGGGGGGGGTRTSRASDYTDGIGKTAQCLNWGTIFGGGGGGGGGASHVASSGGAGSTSTTNSVCTGTVNGSAGNSGTTAGGGTGGSAGTGRYQVPGASQECDPCLNFNGTAGGNGGPFGTAGFPSGGAGGAAGYSVRNYGHCNWTNNGVLTGPTLI